jgi:hypothetical protein
MVDAGEVAFQGWDYVLAMARKPASPSSQGKPLQERRRIWAS